MHQSGMDLVKLRTRLQRIELPNEYDKSWAAEAKSDWGILIIGIFHPRRRMNQRKEYGVFLRFVSNILDPESKHQ